MIPIEQAIQNIMDFKDMYTWTTGEEPLDAGDTIYRQAAIDAIIEDKIGHNSLKIMTAIGDGDKAETLNMTCDRHAKMLMGLPPAQPEQPPYVAEIEAEYQKAVKMPHIHKPLAKALYEVWKKHDREDAERREE